MKIKAIHEIYYTGADGKREVAVPGTIFEPVGDMLKTLSKAAYSVVTEEVVDESGESETVVETAHKKPSSKGGSRKAAASEDEVI